MLNSAHGTEVWFPQPTHSRRPQKNHTVFLAVERICPAFVPLDFLIFYSVSTRAVRELGRDKSSAGPRPVPTLKFRSNPAVMLSSFGGTPQSALSAESLSLRNRAVPLSIGRSWHSQNQRRVQISGGFALLFTYESFPGIFLAFCCIFF